MKIWLWVGGILAGVAGLFAIAAWIAGSDEPHGGHSERTYTRDEALAELMRG